ncbi:hypothetical protein AGMMS49995_11130 [Endomicrobiia bacterium]|nr:hypothetical protein AGMMS49995_11130 [Endomicrobiia bacterium]
MPFQKGEPKPENSGWKPETKEKRRKAHEVFYKVYNDIGGDEAFVKWASQEENRGQFYKMYSKQLPTEVSISGSEDNTTPINIMVPASVLKV